MKRDTKFKTLLFLYNLALLGFAGLVVISGWLNEPARQLFYFITNSEAKTQNLTFELAAGLILLDLLMGISIYIILCLVVSKKPQMHGVIWEKLVNVPLYRVLYTLLACVNAEEILFRWLPLAILWPAIGRTQINMWALIIISSMIFGIWHIVNQKPGNRQIVYTLPQIMGGVFLSYVYLAFGFQGAVIIHLSFDVLLILGLWLGHRTETGEIKVEVYDNSSKTVIPNTTVNIYSDNGIRCVTTPCPDGELQEWQGTTDGNGIISVPKRLINTVTTISLIGYQPRDLRNDSQKITDSYWLIYLDPEPQNEAGLLN